MKRLLICFAVIACLLSACKSPTQSNEEITYINLSDTKITINGTSTADTANGVYIANDIVYYQSGNDFTYGEGTETDAHSAEEALSHTVVHITKAGKYSLSGTLSKGQIAIDLGEDAKKDKNAVVTLILNNADITCTVAPAIIFYNVYECGSDDEDDAAKDVDTSKAGANVIIADGSTNNINGSYVAKIYKSYELNDAGTEVIESKKLHKYDGAFYSKMSMNVNGENNGNGVLNINAQNEGLGTELHLTINGGIININSGNDGINTNEDNISVTTINGGELNITVNGATGEGDGIDSNGWLVINGGKISAYACSFSADSGIDSDKGIHINGGTVVATGSMLDKIENGSQPYALFNFQQKQKGGTPLTLKDNEGNAVLDITPNNDFSLLIISAPDLTGANYTLYSGETQIATQGGMRPDGTRPEPPNGERPEFPDGERPEPPNGEHPEFPDGSRPEPPNGERPELPDGSRPEPPQMP